MKKNKQINIFVSALAILLVASLCFAFFSGKRSVAQSETDLVTESPFQAVGSEILALLNDLKSIKIDGSIFASQMFIELQDFSVIIPEELKGRENPFDPIGIDTTKLPPTPGPIIPPANDGGTPIVFQIGL